MKTKFYVVFSAIVVLSLLTCNRYEKSTANKYIIQKKNGKIILAYKAFDDFLNSDRSWKSYNAILLDAYPTVRIVHNRQVGWGVIDTLKFPEEIRNYKKEDFEKYMTQYDRKALNYLYDSVIEMAHKILPPVTNKKVDLCFFLPYGSCFVIPEDTLNTIFISMYIDPHEVEKIMAHEYAHILHHDRCPKEPLSLKREIVSEGMAVYLTNLIIKGMELYMSSPLMIRLVR